MLGIQLFCHLHHGSLGGLQCLIKPLQHSHGEDDLAVLVGLEKAHQMGGDFPDEVGLGLYVGVGLLLQLVHRHSLVSSCQSKEGRFPRVIDDTKDAFEYNFSIYYTSLFDR